MLRSFRSVDDLADVASSKRGRHFAGLRRLLDRSHRRPGRITETRAHPDGGMEFDLRVENPLADVAEAECSVDAPDGQGVNIIVGGIPPLDEKVLTTRMQDLPEDTSADEFDVSCTAET